MDESLPVLWEDGETVFCRGSRLGAEGSRNTVLAVLLAAEKPDQAVALLSSRHGIDRDPLPDRKLADQEGREQFWKR